MRTILFAACIVGTASYAYAQQSCETDTNCPCREGAETLANLEHTANTPVQGIVAAPKFECMAEKPPSPLSETAIERFEKRMALQAVIHPRFTTVVVRTFVIGSRHRIRRGARPAKSCQHKGAASGDRPVFFCFCFLFHTKAKGPQTSARGGP